MRPLALALALALAATDLRAQDPLSGRTDGFAMLNDRIGVVVTGLEGVPGGIARAIVGGFVETVGAGSAGADLLNAQRVIILRGYPATIGGASPGLVIDWRVSMDGGTDLGALYSVAEAPDWLDLGDEGADAMGRELAARFLAAHFTAAVVRASGEGAVLLE